MPVRPPHRAMSLVGVSRAMRCGSLIQAAAATALAAAALLALPTLVLAAAVSGRVVEASGGRPARSPCVSLGFGLHKGFIIHANSRGLFRFENVPATKVTVEAYGCPGPSSRLYLPSGFQKRVSLDLRSGSEGGVTLAVRLAGSVTGRILDAATRRPARGACVNVDGTLLSAPHGIFHAYGVRPGRVTIEYRDCRGALNPGYPFALTYWPGTTFLPPTVGHATVRAGRTTNLSDVSLTRTGRISGQVSVASDASAAANRCVVFSNGVRFPQRITNPAVTGNGGVLTDAQGSFRSPPLPPAAYTIGVTDRFCDGPIFYLRGADGAPARISATATATVVGVGIVVPDAFLAGLP